MGRLNYRQVGIVHNATNSFPRLIGRMTPRQTDNGGTDSRPIAESQDRQMIPVEIRYHETILIDTVVCRWLGGQHPFWYRTYSC